MCDCVDVVNFVLYSAIYRYLNGTMYGMASPLTRSFKSHNDVITLKFELCTDFSKTVGLQRSCMHRLLTNNLSTVWNTIIN